ncbi:MAG: hypothetical protein M3O50_09195 [Myxococcota bacterium]|nr:hypothetical protein [Myxococcota bacterium]
MSQMQAPKTPVIDPHGLLPSGEPMATLAELAGMFDVSMNALRIVLQERAAGGARYVRRSPSRETLYAIADVRSAIAENRAWLDERRRVAAELEAMQRAAKALKKAANEAASSTRRDRPAPASKKMPRPRAYGSASERRGPITPEVIVRKAR